MFLNGCKVMFLSRILGSVVAYRPLEFRSHVSLHFVLSEEQKGEPNVRIWIGVVVKNTLGLY